MTLMELYGKSIFGAMRGLDRIRFRGTIRWLANELGLAKFLGRSCILLKDFGAWAQEKTRQVRDSCRQRSEELGIEMIYLASSGEDKEALAREVARKKGIREGSICMFSVVEPCWSPTVVGNRKSQKLEVRMRPRKGVWIYHYWDDPQFGFGHVRLQTWLPMTVNICLNGRHWLEQQLQRDGVGYVKDGNCFPWVERVERAQELLGEQLKTNWTEELNRLTEGACPGLEEILAPLQAPYYWSADETEWATDFLFHSSAELDQIYPSLLQHAMKVSDSPTVLRYLGKGCISRNGKAMGNVPREILSDLRRRTEGIRVKHWINQNSIKMYNKNGSILRIETTINNSRDFKVYRSANDDPERKPSWQLLRKGVSDLHRRCQVSDQANERYAKALSTAQAKETVKETVGGACKPVTKNHRRYRALNPWNPEDFRLLSTLAKGEFAIRGFRNKELRPLLFPESAKVTAEEQKRYSGRVTRRLQLLRAHEIVKKVSRENRYVLTDRGRKFATAMIAAHSADVKKLMELAA